MHKTKKKTKTVKLPKPIKVKKEKSDEDRLPRPMTHYLDDRLEMIRQIFNTLKPKTIINLAPDFLKTQALEEIEEACLNELLCISTKRLNSIITATKCPTDTESSDNDSDVERHEEHVSLEEISSDSEIEGSSSKKTKKKKSTTKATDETGNTAKKDTSNEDNQEDGQISVLELLELQARARAIRSQLALEPVTKIEVNSDEEKRKENKEKQSMKDDKTNRSERKRSSNERESRDSAKLSRTIDSTDSLNIEKRSTNQIKLKRNYRRASNQEKEDEPRERHDSEKESKDKPNKSLPKDKLKENEKTKSRESSSVIDIKKEKKSRSPSPDVIPIVAEPETLLITDSSDEDHAKESKKTSGGNEKTKKVSAALSNIVNQEERKGKKKEVEKPNEETENQRQQKSTTIANKTEQNTCDSEKIMSENIIENTQGSEIKISTSIKNDTCDENKVKTLQTKNSLNKKSNDETHSTNQSDDDQNEDVISLGGDLENEMNEELEKEVNAIQSPYNKTPKTENSSQDNNKLQDESQTEDVISLESSGDERTDDNQSWHSRYMKSSKVSKVLAASRLGKRVRDKIKKSKNSKKDGQHESVEAEKEKSAAVFTSKHEDGSVEQYKELLEMRPRKQ